MGGEDFQAGRKAEPQPCPSNFPIFSFIKSSFAHIATDTLRRTSRALFNVQATVTGGVLLLAKGASSSSDGYPRLNSSRPSYAEFQLSEADPGTDEGQRVLADVNNFVPTSSQDWNQWGLWVKRAESIRSSGRPDYCVGNLSIALSEVGAAYQAGASGATTLLTLLPTAGALIGAPSKELWVLYKLVPIAGLLSMLLSLGGNIMPMEVNSYERMDTFTYSGMMASRPDEMITAPTAKHAASGGSEAEFFADEVHSRAMDHGGSKKSIAVLCGILLQLLWLGCIVGACWFTVSGGIVVWWCTVSQSRGCLGKHMLIDILPTDVAVDVCLVRSGGSLVASGEPSRRTVYSTVDDTCLSRPEDPHQRRCTVGHPRTGHPVRPTITSRGRLSPHDIYVVSRCYPTRASEEIVYGSG